MDLTPAELTVLGLLVEQPRHGYDLEQVIEHRGIRQWTEIGFSSIYYLLTKLEKRQLVEAVGPSGGGARSRRVFRATARGRRLAAEQARAFIDEVRPVPHPAMVGLANLALLAAGDYLAALRSRLDQLDDRIASIRAAEQAQAPLPEPAREVFSFSLCLLVAERSWLAERVGGADA